MTAQLTLADAAPHPSTKHRRSDPPTAVKAAHAAFPLAGTQRRRILEAIWRAGDGLTYEQVSERTGIRGVSASTRISELSRGGWIEPAGERETSAMTNATIWRATEKAQREVARFA